MQEFQQQFSSEVRALPRRTSSVDTWRKRFLHATAASLAFLFVAALVLGLVP
jgi:hypothetical protein